MANVETMASASTRGSILVEEGHVVRSDAHDGAQHVLRIHAPRIAERCKPGHFIHLRCGPELPMRRPMSIMRAHSDGTIEVLFKVHGHGTSLLAGRAEGDKLSIIGPIGKPFKRNDYATRTLLIGGGVGIPPMIFLAEHLRRESTTPFVVMGSEVPFPFPVKPSTILVPGLPAEVIGSMPLLEDWGIASRLASQQGYAGCYDGFVTTLADHWISRQLTEGESDIEIFSCGPTPMLKAVAALARKYSLGCQISLEEYMACAVGGCAGCVVRVKSKAGDAMKRVCVDGPVFEASTVVFQ